MEQKILRNQKKQVFPFFKKGWSMKLATLLSAFAVTGASASAPTCSNYGTAQPQNIFYTINSNTFTSLSGNLAPGATVTVFFDLSSPTDTTMFSLVAYKAPGSTYNAATAPLQTIYNVDTRTFYGTGTHNLTVVVPHCYYQVDFVKGCPIVELGAGGNNDYYSAQGRLIASDNGGMGQCSCVAQADAGSTSTLSCTSSTLNLQGSTWVHNPTISWQAYAGGTITAGMNSLNPTINGAGSYVLSVTDSLNCTATSTVVVTGGQMHVNLGNDTTMMTCSHQTLTLNAGVSPATYSWSTGATTQTINVSSTGVYTVGVTNGSGCVGTDTISITIQDNTVDVNLGNDTTVCGCIQLSAGHPGDSYSWCSGETYANINVCHTGIFCVKVGNGMCYGYDTIHVTVAPVPTVSLGRDTTDIVGTLVLDAGNNGSTYLWSNGATTQTIAVSGHGTYYVTVKNAAGCTASDTIHLGTVQAVIEQAAASFSMNLFPNPAKEKRFDLSLVADHGEQANITICNQLGVSVYSETIDEFKGSYNKSISLGNCAAGLYYVTIMSKDTKRVAKIALD